MKSFLGFLVYAVTIGIVLAILTSWWVFTQFTKPGPLPEPVTIHIERGNSFNTISDKLLYIGAFDLNGQLIFNAGILLHRARRDLKAGEYEIPAQASMYEIMQILREGKTVIRRFTIREGLTSFEIVRHLNGIENLSGEITAIPPEGSLLPNTYDYQLHEDRNAVLARLQREMQSTIDTLWPQRADDLPIQTKEEAVILASIIEKETAVPDERGQVAGVFINRLKRGMPLQTDPTVIYAITKGKHKNDGRGPLGRRLLKKDLQIDSPYNTYKYPGLPPGPIANPGRESIEAALNPQAHDYIFFVANGTGGHAFAKTLAEHNRNVAKWRKIRQRIPKRAD